MTAVIANTTRSFLCCTVTLFRVNALFLTHMKTRETNTGHCTEQNTRAPTLDFSFLGSKMLQFRQDKCVWLKCICFALTEETKHTQRHIQTHTHTNQGLVLNCTYGLI